MLYHILQQLLIFSSNRAIFCFSLTVNKFQNKIKTKSCWIMFSQIYSAKHWQVWQKQNIMTDSRQYIRMVDISAGSSCDRCVLWVVCGVSLGSGLLVWWNKLWLFEIVASILVPILPDLTGAIKKNTWDYSIKTTINRYIMADLFYLLFTKSYSRFLFLHREK